MLCGYSAARHRHSFSLHDALPIFWLDLNGDGVQDQGEPGAAGVAVELYRGGAPDASTTTDDGGWYTFAGQANVYRSEEHTSELQSHHEAVCRRLLEKNNHRALARR